MHGAALVASEFFKMAGFAATDDFGRGCGAFFFWAGFAPFSSRAQCFGKHGKMLGTAPGDNTALFFLER